jgi:hypothetical protein
MTEPGRIEWTYATLTLAQPGWPGTKKAEWIATVDAVERFRTRDALQAMNRLGAEGWELVAFCPGFGDRSSCFYFKAPRDPRAA